MKYHDFNDPEYIEDQQQQEYWQRKQAENAKNEKLVKIVIVIAIVIMFLGSSLFAFFLLNSMKPIDPRWFEARSAVDSIKQAVDIYSVKNGNDINGLDDPPGTLDEGFRYGSNLLTKLKLDAIVCERLMHFDAKDFSLKFVTDGTDGQYIITVDASKGNGGSSGSGPKDGIGIYNSSTDEWTGKFKGLQMQPTVQMPNSVNPITNSPPAIMVKDFDPGFEVKKLSDRDLFDEDQGVTHVHSVVSKIASSIEKYAEQHNGDISGLDNPAGTLKQGFVRGSKLIEKLTFDTTPIDESEFLDAEDFSVEFVTDGKNGYYIIKVNTSKGRNDTTGKRSGVKAEYNSLTGTYDCEFGD